MTISAVLVKPFLDAYLSVVSSALSMLIFPWSRARSLLLLCHKHTRARGKEVNLICEVHLFCPDEIIPPLHDQTRGHKSQTKERELSAQTEAEMETEGEKKKEGWLGQMLSFYQ